MVLSDETIPSVIGAALLAGAATGALVTGLVRRLALRHAILDVPNDRSLHRTPTPRGGGLSIVLVAVLALGWTGRGSLPQWGPTTALLLGCVLVAGIGWLDDLRGLPARVRALVHAVAAGLFLHAIGGFPSLGLGGLTVPLGKAGAVLALLGIVWCVNLYNFMDGIDGLAGAQAALMSGFGVVVFAGPAPGLALVAAAVAGASLGFLLWNWSPAKIFMGDAGSCMLGFLFAAFALESERRGVAPLWAWMLVGLVFFGDATLTVVRRFLRGERVYAAHRSHAYQRAVQSGFSHATTSTGMLLLGVLFASLAYAGMKKPELVAPAAVAVLVIFLVAYLWVERRAPMRPPS